MEADLGTKLDWIAVDHHNTGHPHTQIIVRAVTDDGKTLNVAGDYIAHGIRERASEVVTRELGRQTEQANLIAVYCIVSWRIFWMTMLHRSTRIRLRPLH